MAQRVLGLGRARRVSGYLKKMVPGAFLQEFFAQPGIVGAICPSSPFLAHRMAREVSHIKDGLIIELGPGTGVVTKALLKQGVAPERLLVLEYSNRFVQRLRRQFPLVNIVHGNAADLCRIVPAGTKVSAIVSSLPLCSLPEPLMQSIVQQWRELLHDSGVAVQFTYNLHRPAWHKHVQGVQTGSSIVWGNLPPARVSTFSFHTHKLSSPHHEHPPAEHPG
ncbi:class I SAM-dependent methyltransferase [Pollutimonas harenae]|uniref:Methyltransferase domain-containing protein n=1 Tax=Pollutimonas harenae TaxID=657015 RepID=A0A853GVE2_9BURK|nr:methyltransferase domain-containing protein [Pollutimonas harenae]NYT86107.1 methyltransferase domain-containing protein [Pollutimonas harenae]TEA71150.1 methyltransferase domain-containing protein [Pollutimonas harenae]